MNTRLMLLAALPFAFASACSHISGHKPATGDLSSAVPTRPNDLGKTPKSNEQANVKQAPSAAQQPGQSVAATQPAPKPQAPAVPPAPLGAQGERGAVVIPPGPVHLSCSCRPSGNVGASGQLGNSQAQPPKSPAPPSAEENTMDQNEQQPQPGAAGTVGEGQTPSEPSAQANLECDCVHAPPAPAHP